MSGLYRQEPVHNSLGYSLFYFRFRTLLGLFGYVKGGVSNEKSSSINNIVSMAVTDNPISPPYATADLIT